jgi:circadian clock protein KaiC
MDEKIEHDVVGAKAGRAMTGIAGLDDILNGGFIEHRMYLVEGNPGSGKTTLALQFLFAGVKAGGKMPLHHTLGDEGRTAGRRGIPWLVSGRDRDCRIDRQ